MYYSSRDRKFTVLLIFVLTVIVFSCRKDDPINDPPDDPNDTIGVSTPTYQVLNINDITIEDTSCHPLFDDSSFVFPVQITHNIKYKTPCFNPNNSNEFIYYYKNGQTGTNQLIKYDLTTEQKTTIINGFSSTTEPKWDYNDDVVYNRTFDVYTANSDGSNVQLIYDQFANLYPVSDPNDKYIYWQHSQSSAVPYYFLRYNKSNSVIDTLLYPTHETEGYVTIADISSDNKLLCETIINERKFIAYTSLDDFHFQGLIDIESNQELNPISDVCWHPNGEDFYFTVKAGYGGIYKMNINDLSNATKLVDCCPSKIYDNISISPDANYLVGERINRHRDTVENKTYAYHYIYKINLNTLEETKIDLE